MHVAMVCPYSLSRPGGVQNQVLSMAASLERIGHHTAVLAPSEDAGRRPRHRERDGARGALTGHDGDGDGVELLPLGRSVPVPANGSVAPVALNPAVALRAMRLVRSGGFDVVHLHEPLAPVAGYATLFGCSEPKVGTFHRAGSGAVYRLLGVPARALVRRLDVSCAVSPEASATASKVVGGEYEIVGNGVDVERFETAEPWPTRAPTVIFLGRHEARKGLSVLLEAWSLLARRHPGDMVLWVAGEGPQTTRLRARHPGGRTLEWLGRISNEEAASRLKGAHVLCAPSTGGESFGMVLAEAMCARTAVVASDIPGYAYVTAGHGLLARPGDARSLSDALRRALFDAEEGVGICSPYSLDLALSHVRQWSMAAVASRYVSIYERLVS